MPINRVTGKFIMWLGLAEWKIWGQTKEINGPLSWPNKGQEYLTQCPDTVLV